MRHAREDGSVGASRRSPAVFNRTCAPAAGTEVPDWRSAKPPRSPARYATDYAPRAVLPAAPAAVAVRRARARSGTLPRFQIVAAGGARRPFVLRFVARHGDTRARV